MNLSTSKISEKLTYDLTKEDKSEIKIDYRNSNYKIIEISFPELDNKTVKYKQNFVLGKGGIFWDGAYFLTKFMLEKYLNEENEDENNIKNVLELGAGTALPSIVCLIKGLRVVTTDIPKMIPFIEEIINNNKSSFNKNSHSIISELSWEKEEDIQRIFELNKKNPFDLIIGSELIYLDDLFDDLIHVLDILSDKNTIILFSYKIRLPEMVEQFLQKLKQKFEIKFIDFALKNELYTNPDKLQLIKITKK